MKEREDSKKEKEKRRNIKIKSRVQMVAPHKVMNPIGQSGRYRRRCYYYWCVR